jgi:hypothetical protein
MSLGLLARIPTGLEWSRSVGLLLVLVLLVCSTTNSAWGQDSAPASLRPATAVPGPEFFDPASPQAQARAELMRELLDTEAELAVLRAQRPRLVGPIALQIVGGVIGISTSFFGFIWWKNNDQDRYGFRANGDRYQYNDPEDHRTVLWFASLGAVGGAFLIGGTTLLIKTLRLRRENSRQIVPRRQRREELRELLQAGVFLRSGHMAGTLGMKF